MTRIRTTRQAVETIAAVNRAPLTASSFAASVRVSGATYFWCAS